MKSYIIRNEDRKRVEQYAKRQTEIMQQTYINLVLKLMAVVLHDLYGFGKDRFAKVLCAFTKDEVISWDWYWVLSPYIIYDVLAILAFAIKGAGRND